MTYPVPSHIKMHVELHHNVTTKATQMVMRGGGHWLSCSIIDIIVTAANRVWERGQSNEYYNPTRINMRGELKTWNGRIV